MANPVVELSVTKTLVAWAERATKQGLDLSADLQPSIDDPAQMQRLVHYIQAGAPIVRTSGIVYDAPTVSRILGLPVECNEPVPQAADGEIVVYYGGWDLKQLRTSAAGKKRMWQDQNWYEKYGWKAEPGYYRLLLPVPNSNLKTWSDQLSHLASINTAWQPSPVCIAATALLVHLTETGNDLLKNNWCRCMEALPRGFHAGLGVREGRVRVDDRYWDDYPSDYVFLGAARKIRTLKS